ncbi:hypothetical protein ACVWWG_009476 [Bradyrhizobium sp. LB7.2]
MTLQSSASPLVASNDKAVARAEQSHLDWWSIAAIAPAITILLGFLFLFFYGVFQSLTDLKFGRPLVHFVGLNNYAALIRSDDFWNVSAKPIPLLQNSNERAKEASGLDGGFGWDWTAKRTSIWTAQRGGR